MDDLVRLESRYTFDQTLDRVRSTLTGHGFTVFAEIDQLAAARSVGLEMPPTVALIYGNPRGGTPLMVAAPDFAVELPLKVVVREGAGGAVTVVYRPARSLEGAHGLPAGLASRLAAPEPLIAEAAGVGRDVP